MKRILIGFILTISIGCNRTIETKEDKKELKIKLEIVPEDVNGSYYITWRDTIGQSKNYKINDRPFEVWCLLRNGKDTVGFYLGMSTPRDYEYFTTKDSIVQVTFMIGYNIFSDKLTKEIFDRNKEIVEFNPIEINIKKDLRTELEFLLTEK